MISALRWIWDAVKRILLAVVQLGSNVTTWLLAGLVTFSNVLLEGLSALAQSAFPEIEWPSLSALVDEHPLFAAFVDVCALDEAASSVVTLLAAWVACRVARLAAVPIRALLEIL